MTDQLSRTDIDAALAEAKRQISDNGAGSWRWALLIVTAWRRSELLVCPGS